MSLNQYPVNGAGLSEPGVSAKFSYGGPTEYLFANLPNGGARGTTVWTDDVGLCVWNGFAWAGVGGSGSTGAIYGSSVSATLALGDNDNLSPSGNVPGVTNRYLLTPNAGGSNWLGLVAAPDGWSVWAQNMSSSVAIIIKNKLSSISANQFQGPNNANFSLAPGAGKFLVYVVNQWTMTT